MKMSGKSSLFVVLALLSWSTKAHSSSNNANFVLSNTLGDHMVLQRDTQNAMVWGYANANAQVSLEFNSNVYNTTVPATGIFKFALPSTPGSTSPYTLTFTCTPGCVPGSLALTDVLFGDVFLVGGQSNAVFTVSQGFNASEEIGNIGNNYPYLRLFSAANEKSSKPLTQLPSVALPWSVASASSVGGNNWTFFSAIGWFFARDLYQRNGGSVPIGVICSAYGGTLIQEHTLGSALGQQCNQGPNPAKPGMNNSDVYFAMISPFTVGPTALKSIVFYQAESNIDIVAPGFGGEYYKCQFPLTITSWREEFQNPTLPWVFVQLAAYTAKSGDSKDILPTMRDGQVKGGLSVPNTWFVTASDLGDTGSPWTDIHPRKKQPLGSRLAAAVLYLVYQNTSVIHSGGMYQSSTLVTPPPKQGYASIHVRFDPSTVPAGRVSYASNGMAQVCPPSYNATAFCAGFEMVFSDGSLIEVDISNNPPIIDSDGLGVIISAPIPPSSPTAVGTRYAFAPWPVTTLYSADDSVFGGVWPVLPWNENITS